MEPTQEQIKEFWEWCGFKPPDMTRVHWHAKRPDFTDMPDGTWPPDIDLNNLFKYAVPKLLPKHDFAIYYVLDVDTPPEGAWTISMSCSGHGEHGIIRLRHKDPALALFWAIWGVIKDG